MLKGLLTEHYRDISFTVKEFEIQRIDVYAMENIMWGGDLSAYLLN